jgi:hypothetical protein
VSVVKNVLILCFRLFASANPLIIEPEIRKNNIFDFGFFFTVCTCTLYNEHGKFTRGHATN